MPTKEKQETFNLGSACASEEHIRGIIWTNVPWASQIQNLTLMQTNYSLHNDYNEMNLVRNEFINRNAVELFVLDEMYT